MTINISLGTLVSHMWTAFSLFIIVLHMACASVVVSVDGTMVQSMRAVNVGKPTTAADLSVSEVPASPAAGQGELRIRVYYSALNRADILQRNGAYPSAAGSAFGSILGLEAAGIVDQVGANVTGWQIGDRVCCLLSGGVRIVEFVGDFGGGDGLQ
jgi:NADPH:quinone reductase-like Zn-dependent oxidoreductase